MVTFRCRRNSNNRLKNFSPIGDHDGVDLPTTFGPNGYPIFNIFLIDF